jgi:TPR repeat protein
MLKILFRTCMIPFLSLSLCACATFHPNKISNFHKPAYSPATVEYLEQGRRYLQQGYYKKAMHILLPLACDGIPEAQYAVGYMYYYGYGVAQDTDVGYFWIKRAADCGYLPAIKAIAIIERDQAEEARVRARQKQKYLTRYQQKRYEERYRPI